MKLVFLVGMPGAGKTHWGRVWSEQHGFDFADLDEQIEAQAGLSIPEIFKGVGEHGFRVLEASVLLDSIAAAKGRDTIIATGGGTPIFDSNMNTMLRAGCVVYFTAKIETLLAHIAASESLRPLLKDFDAAALEIMFETRRVFYERAHSNVAVEDIRTGTFTQMLHECTSRQS